MSETEPAPYRGRSWAREADRYGDWGPDALYRDPGYSAWQGVDIHDELWRAENPGSSLARGLLWAVPLSAALWALAALAVCAVVFG